MKKENTPTGKDQNNPRRGDTNNRKCTMVGEDKVHILFDRFSFRSRERSGNKEPRGPGINQTEEER